MKVKISFIHLTEFQIRDNLVKLTSSVHSYQSKKRKISSILKTISLFDLGEHNGSYVKTLFSYYDLSVNKEEFRSVLEFIKSKAANKVKVENYHFVKDLIVENDLQYLDNRFLVREEIQYYLYRMSSLITEEKYKGSRVLSRNYLLSIKDNYKRNTGRNLNRNKLAHLNKLLNNLGLIRTQDGRRFTIGENHPLYNTDLIKKSVRESEIKEVIPLSESLRLMKQDYDNLVKSYQELNSESESLRGQVEYLTEELESKYELDYQKEDEEIENMCGLIIGTLEDLEAVKDQIPVNSCFD